MPRSDLLDDMYRSVVTPPRLSRYVKCNSNMIFLQQLCILICVPAPGVPPLILRWGGILGWRSGISL